ncbi:MAG: acyl-CoA dehydrogenase family protein [Myxococcota bacterium]|nr:acyl-CoA dehydrogenase family protein [Myxococcota bacterium]
MHVDFTPEQKKLRQEIRDYYRELFTPELRAAFDEELEQMGGPVFRELVRRMGKDGWLGIGWPKEYGGQGASPIEQFIFWDETYRARAPLHIIPVNTIGPTIMQFGSEEQKQTLLPGILAGELFFGVGYTEPNAGTDLASLQTRAVRDGDDWVINGQKVYTTFGHIADYIWLAARTDSEAPKHAGISIILVPTDVPGYTATPIMTLGKERTNATYYQDVRVPASNLIGPLNGGWGLITAQLNHERIALAVPGHCENMMDEVWRHAGSLPAPGGGTMLDQQWVQVNLARVYAKLRALQVLNWRSAWALTEGIPSMAEASALKVMGTEFFVEAYNLLLEITGAAGIVLEGQPGCLFGGLLETAYRGATTLTFGGGVNEVQRDIIAAAGLGMPRGRARK